MLEVRSEPRLQPLGDDEEEPLVSLAMVTKLQVRASLPGIPVLLSSDVQQCGLFGYEHRLEVMRAGNSHRRRNTRQYCCVGAR